MEIEPFGIYNNSKFGHIAKLQASVLCIIKWEEVSSLAAVNLCLSFWALHNLRRKKSFSLPVCLYL